MSQRDFVPPPPFVGPDLLPATDEAPSRFFFVKFSGKYHIPGSERSDLIVALRGMSETMLIIETSCESDLYVLFRVEDSELAAKNLHDWIDLITHQRIFESVSMGWVKNGEELVRFIK